MAFAAPHRHRASTPKHASRPSTSPAPSASGSKPVSAQVSVGESASSYDETRQGHPLFGTRYYDPSVGRWTQQDAVAGSIGDPASVNRYVYVGNDPINDFDPTGYASAKQYAKDCVAWGTGGAIAGSIAGPKGAALGFAGGCVGATLSNLGDDLFDL